MTYYLRYKLRDREEITIPIQGPKEKEDCVEHGLEKIMIAMEHGLQWTENERTHYIPRGQLIQGTIFFD